MNDVALRSSGSRRRSGRLDTHAGLALLATLLLWGSTPAESPVADAAMRGDLTEVRTLLRSGADVNAAQGDGMTALHWSAEIDDAEMAAVLLSAGANPAALTRLGDYTALHVAARARAAGVAQALLDAGADPEARTSTGQPRSTVATRSRDRLTERSALIQRWIAG